MKICNKFFAELFGTFVLVFGGLAIGLTLTLIHFISIPLTNTSVNPARSLGVALFSDCEKWSAMGQLWLFFLAPLAGAFLAGIAYKCITGSCNKNHFTTLKNDFLCTFNKCKK